MTNDEIQDLMNVTFEGLAIFCRDLELSKELIAKYHPNQIIMERGFVDLSYKIGGLTKNCRYLVASSQGKNLSMFDPQAQTFGHVLLRSGSFFKVLDIQQMQGKTQILLLNIPEEGAQIFEKMKVNIEDEIIAKAVDIFEENLKDEPIPALQTQEWLERTSFPIGMSDEGVFFWDTQLSNERSNEPDAINAQESDTKNTESPKQEKKGLWSKLFGK